MKKVIKPKFTVEFKREAAQLIITYGYSYSEAAKRLGVSESALRKWVNMEKSPIISNPNKANKLTLTEHDELIKLRKEVSRLRMEKEILKKASAFFAQEIL